MRTRATGEEEGRVTESERLAPLDFLRGLAILMVVVFHVSIYFAPNQLVGRITSYGAHGVQLFFIVSAITMCHMWHVRAGESERAARFYIRRMARIGVVFWAFTPFYLLLKWFEGNPEVDPQISTWQLISTLSLTHGLSPVTNNAIIPGGWSIGVEVIFYVLFPWLVRVCSGNLRTIAWMVAIFACINIGATQALRTFASELFSGVDDAQMREYLYQSILTQLPVFFFGILVYRLMLAGDRANLIEGVATLLAWFVVTFALRSYTNLLGRPYFWLVCTLLACMSAVCIAFSVRQALISWMGRMSYSMYIIHFAVIDAARTLIPDDWPVAWSRYVFACASVLLASCLLSEVSRRFLESRSVPLSRYLLRQVDLARRFARSPK